MSTSMPLPRTYIMDSFINNDDKRTVTKKIAQFVNIIMYGDYVPYDFMDDSDLIEILNIINSDTNTNTNTKRVTVVDTDQFDFRVIDSHSLYDTSSLKCQLSTRCIKFMEECVNDFNHNDFDHNYTDDEDYTDSKLVGDIDTILTGKYDNIFNNYEKMYSVDSNIQNKRKKLNCPYTCPIL